MNNFIYSIPVWDKMARNLEAGRKGLDGSDRVSDPRHFRAYLIFFFTFVPGPSLFTKIRSESCTLPKTSQSQGKFSSFLIHIREMLASLPSFSDKLPNKRIVLHVAGGKFRCCPHKIF
jgi:hypothetical protein